MVARCVRAAASHIVRLRYASRTSTTVVDSRPPTSSAATPTSDSCENLGSALADWPRCSTVSTSAAPQRRGQGVRGDQPDRARDRQRTGGAADQVTAVAVDVEHRHRGQPERDDRRAVGHRAHQCRRHRVLVPCKHPCQHFGDRDFQGSAAHHRLTGRLWRRTAQTAPPATIRPAATATVWAATIVAASEPSWPPAPPGCATSPPVGGTPLPTACAATVSAAVSSPAAAPRRRAARLAMDTLVIPGRAGPSSRRRCRRAVRQSPRARPGGAASACSPRPQRRPTGLGAAR